MYQNRCAVSFYWNPQNHWLFEHILLIKKLSAKVIGIHRPARHKKQNVITAGKQGYETGITYEQLARIPDSYIYKKVKFSGNVIQVLKGDNEVNIDFWKTIT